MPVAPSSGHIICNLQKAISLAVLLLYYLTGFQISIGRATALFTKNRLSKQNNMGTTEYKTVRDQQGELPNASREGLICFS